MARMVFLGCYTPASWKGIIGGSDRKAAVQALMDQVGGTVETVMFTRGEFDVMATADLPDQASGIGVAMAIHASGAFTRISLLEELDMEAAIAAAQKAAAVYTPANQ